MSSHRLRINGRSYLWPKSPVVVICLDGSPYAYLERAVAALPAPFMGRLIHSGQLRLAQATMPTFTNPNNVSIITGVCPAKHGISGNYFFDTESGRAFMMNDPGFLRWDLSTIMRAALLGGDLRVM